MSEFQLYEHFDALFSGMIAIVFGVSAAVFSLYRKVIQVQINEERIKSIEHKLDAEIEKAGKDHAEIRSAVQDTRETQARQSADIEHIKRAVDRLLDNNNKKN